MQQGMRLKTSVAFLRIGMGWLFFYAGITKLLNPAWSAAGYLGNVQTFPELYAWLASPAILPYTNALNEWGLTLIGISLIFGIFVRVCANVGALMMVLYYFPALSFPYAGANGFIMDEHVIYFLVLSLLCALKAGRTWGLDSILSRNTFLEKYLS